MRRISSQLLLAVFFSGFVLPAAAQVYGPANLGIKKERDQLSAFTGATVHLDARNVIEGATLLIRNDRVEAVGKNVEIPAQAEVIDATGKHIYPSFIELFSGFSIKPVSSAQGSGRSAEYEATREGYYWNDHIRPDQRASDMVEYDKDLAGKLRAQGFGLVNSHVEDGVARGTGTLLTLLDQDPEGIRIVREQSGSYFSFQRSSQSRQSYPSSLMGTLALLRQVHHDLAWYRSQKTGGDRALNALNQQQAMPALIAAGNNGNGLRAARLGREIGKDFTILGGGDEFEYTDELKALNTRLVIPVNFPAAYDVSDPFSAGRLPLSQLRQWNQAPANPARVRQAGLSMALTTHGLKKGEGFLDKVREAIRYGLSPEDALDALTAIPAGYIGLSDRAGALRPGYLANFLIVTGPVFEPGSQILENWVQGYRHGIKELPETDIRGTYAYTQGGRELVISITGEAEKPAIEVKQGEQKLSAEISFKDSWVVIRFMDSTEQSFNRFSAKSIKGSKDLKGRLETADGRAMDALLKKTAEPETAKDKKENDAEARELMPVTYPNTAFGRASRPSPRSMVFRSATVWTGSSILENTDVWVENGRIRAVGTGLRARGAQEIDAKGKHLTAGIIDEHSHIGLLSVNESGHNSSAEVRMTEVIDPKDIDIYRNLAGGVTTIQQLHGSANPIGGQSSIIKLKWGENAQGMIFDEAPGFIKFALGENVKQSNWSGGRFPQTRMGVEQVFVDYFTRAREYIRVAESGAPYRKDEDLETLAQILKGERFISCHSYVQSEINMLIKVAERFGIRINTFTHILEGYKVADKMAQHGVGGSTFSDWWAYKYEVIDAIPYNAAIMASQGVTVAINSDDAEMSRRLNQEAAKTVKYGGMSEIEAWKTVTLNPARLLRVDKYVGSIEEGKMADLVLWSDHPLTARAVAEKTIIEGAVYFDREEDAALRTQIDKERKVLIDQMLDQKKKGKPTQAPGARRKEQFTCDTL